MYVMSDRFGDDLVQSWPIGDREGKQAEMTLSLLPR